MTTEEMRTILSTHLQRYRTWSYAQLAERAEYERTSGDCLEHLEGTALDGTLYQVELNTLWDDQPGADIRVMASLSAEPQQRLLGFLPIYVADLCDSFILSPDGTFVGE